MAKTSTACRKNKTRFKYHVWRSTRLKYQVCIFKPLEWIMWSSVSRWSALHNKGHWDCIILAANLLQKNGVKKKCLKHLKHLWMLQLSTNLETQNSILAHSPLSHSSDISRWMYAVDPESKSSKTNVQVKVSPKSRFAPSRGGRLASRPPPDHKLNFSDHTRLQTLVDNPLLRNFYSSQEITSSERKLNRGIEKPLS